MNWYYVDAAGQQAGPVDDAGLEALSSNGTINSETLVWKEGMANWQPYREVRPSASGGLRIATPAPPIVSAAGGGMGASAATGVEEAVCSECGGIFPATDTISIGNTRVCARCKPVVVQKMREGVLKASSNFAHLSFAGFWIRLVAKIVDYLIVGVIAVIPAVIFLAVQVGNVATRGKPNIMAILIFELVIVAGFLILPIIYAGFFIGKYAATPGKMVCGIKVVKSDGSTVGYGRSFGRAAAEVLSRLIWCIGYIIAAFDSEKRTLHDRICNTRVIHK